MRLNKEEYKEFCLSETDLPLFFQYWWLDVVARDNWNVAGVKKDGRVVAVLPYIERKGVLGYSIVQPKLTQFLGPWIKGMDRTNGVKLAAQKDIFNELESSLPSCRSYKQNWSYIVSNWLPFYWRGYSQTTRYTYVLDDINNGLDRIWNSFESKVRSDVRKAQKRFGLNVEEEDVVDNLISLCELTFQRQGTVSPYDRNLVDQLFKEARGRNQARIFTAFDSEGRCYSSVLIVWDESSAYYLMGGSDPEVRNSGSASLCLWEAIKFSTSVTKSFDFEGSMNENIERFVRGFGAKQLSYHFVFKESKYVEFGRSLKAIASIRFGR